MNPLLLAAVLSVSSVQGEAPKNFAFESKLRTLYVFKEGFGFFLREGRVRLENGWATTNLVPRAAVGTFYVYPLTGNAKVDTIVTTPEHRIEFEKPEELPSRLRDKVGLRIAVTTKEGGEAAGVLAKVLDDMLLLRTASGQYTAVEYPQIAKVVLSDFPVRIRVTGAPASAELGLGVAYIQAGVRWQPSYLLELQGEKGALTLRGTLLDVPEELKGTDVVFVVGAPTLMNPYSIDSLLAGLASGAKLEDLAQVGRRMEARDAAAKAPAANESAGVAGGGGFGGGGGGTFATDQSGELQYYLKSDLSLRPGERAMTVLFRADVAVHPFFDWNADGKDVDYVLKMRNTTGYALTMAPAFVLDDGKPVGQPTLNYTAKGDETELRMAQAVGIKVEAREVEVERGESVARGSIVETPITLQGTLSVENFRDKAAEVRIRKTVTGRILEMSHGGEVKNTSLPLGSVNAVNSVEWTITLPAGGKVEVRYRYVNVTATARSGGGG
jgi:hypothetical protein